MEPKSVTTLVVFHLNINRDFSAPSAFDVLAGQIQTLKELSGLVLALFFFLFRRAVVEWHIELRIDMVDHAANGCAIGGCGYYNTPLG